MKTRDVVGFLAVLAVCLFALSRVGAQVYVATPPATLRIDSMGPQASTEDGRVWNLRLRITSDGRADVVAEEVRR